MELPTNNLSRQPESLVVSRKTETPTYFPALQEPVWDARPASNPAGILELWHAARIHKRFLLSLMVLGTLIGFLVGIPKTPLYRSSTTLEVLSLNQDFMNMKQVTPITAGDSSFETSELQTQIRVLSSNSLIQVVLDKLKPLQYAQIQTQSAPFSVWRKFLKLPAHHREELLKRAAQSVKVNTLGRTRLLEISVDSADPRLAADFANTLASEYIAQTIKTRWATTENTNTWLSRELADVRAKLARSEDALQTYARNSGLIFTNSDANIVTEKLQQIQNQLSAATADRIDKQSRNELAVSSPPEALPEVINDPGLHDLGAKILDLRRQIANLSATYTPEFGKAKRLQAELEALELAFKQNRADLLVRMKNEYQEALRREKLLTQNYEAQTRQVAGQGEKSVQYNILKREVESNRQLYDTMLQQLKQSSIVSAMQASNVRVLDPASLPVKPFSPNFKTNSVIGLVCGLLVGIAFMMVKQRSNKTLREPGDLQFWTSLPELGAIPNAPQNASRKFQKVQVPAKPAALASNKQSILIGIDHNEPSTSSDNSLLHQSSLLADAFRSVSTSILFTNRSSAQPRILVLTSTSPADGKTTVIANIGIAMAETKKRVLIIDADLRGPRLHSQFNMLNGKGLTDLLSQQTLRNDEWKTFVQDSNVPGLHILTSRATSQNAVQLLHSPVLPILLEKYRERYDLVLIDTPPMLHIPDARIVGKLADAAILVVRAEKTTRDAIITAKQRFKDDHIYVMGTVLNAWDPKKSQRTDYGQVESTYNRYAAMSETK